MANKTILAIHGWLDNAASFEPLSKLLRDRYQILAVDLPGHGHNSALNHPGLPHFLEWVFYLRNIVTEMKLERPFLLGHSMGGAVTALYASLFPNDVPAVACLDGLGPYTAEADSLQERLQSYFERKKVQEKKKERLYSSLEEMAVRKSQATGMSLHSARLVVARDHEQTPEGFRWRHDPLLNLPTPVRMTEAQVCALLKKIECPVLLIEPAKSLFAREPLHLERKKLVRRLEVANVPGNHYAHMEESQSVADSLLRFFDRSH